MNFTFWWMWIIKLDDGMRNWDQVRHQYISSHLNSELRAFLTLTLRSIDSYWSDPSSTMISIPENKKIKYFGRDWYGKLESILRISMEKPEYSLASHCYIYLNSGFQFSSKYHTLAIHTKITRIVAQPYDFHIFMGKFGIT